MTNKYSKRKSIARVAFLALTISACSSDVNLDKISKTASTASMSDALKAASVQHICGKVAAMIYWEDEDNGYDALSIAHFKVFNAIAFGFGSKSAVPEPLICQVSLNDFNKQMKGQSKRQMLGIDYQPEWPITVEEIKQRCVDGNISSDDYQKWWTEILKYSKTIELIWNDAPILSQDAAGWIDERIKQKPSEKVRILKDYYLKNCI